MHKKFLAVLLCLFFSLSAYGWAAKELESISKTWEEVYAHVARQNAQKYYDLAEKEFARKDFQAAYQNYQKVIKYLNEIKKNKASTKADEDMQDFTIARLNTLALEGIKPKAAAPSKPIIEWQTPPVRSPAGTPQMQELATATPEPETQTPAAAPLGEDTGSKAQSHEAASPSYPDAAAVKPAGIKPPEKVNLLIYANPAGSEIFLNDNQRGKTPRTLALSPGSYKIRISAQPYPDYVKEIILLEGQPQIISADLTKGLVFARMNVTTFPSGAQIFLDQKYIGVSPLMLENLLPGIYQVAAAQSGYFKQSLKAELNAGDLKSLTINLRPLPAEDHKAGLTLQVLVAILLVLLMVFAVLWLKTMRAKQTP